MSAWVGRPEKKEKVYCYIDGGAVRSACSKYAPFFEEHELSLSWSKVAEPYERVFYYDALPGHAKKGESDNEFDERIQRARDKFESMRKTKGIFVNYGVSIRRRKQIEQKRVDTMIAVDMLTHAQRSLVSEVVLVTNDQDFFPVVVAVMELGTKVHLLCDPQKTNDEFMYLSDETSELNLFSIYDWLPDEFQREHQLPTFKDRLGTIRGGAIWNEGSFAVGNDANMWQVLNLGTKESYFHRKLLPLLQFAILEWRNCKELINLLNTVEKKGEEVFLT